MLLSLLSIERVAFGDGQAPELPDILPRLIASAQASGEPLASRKNSNTTYYLRRAEYVGNAEAPFGRVQVAEFFFVRSAPPGSDLPARGHTFVLFFDGALQLRARWELESPLGDLTLEHTKLLVGHDTLVDFAHPPPNGTVVVDGKSQKFPQWKPSGMLHKK